MDSPQGAHADGSASDAGGVLYKRDFWRTENLHYSSPHPRMVKVARIANSLARGRNRTLLDVGCGPTTLASLLQPNIDYYGVDIAIQEPAPNLLEVDLLDNPIGFDGRHFDIVVAQGFFEYVGEFQSQKLAEIAGVLADEGTFIASYVNFGHWHRFMYRPYSNVQPFAKFRTGIAEHFTVQRVVPTSYNLRHRDAQGKLAEILGLGTDLRIPILGPFFAIQYILLCTKRDDARRTRRRGI
jgi:SAM-dependent methyltransferase